MPLALPAARPLGLLLAALLTVAGSTAGLLGTPAAAAEPDLMAGAPAVGECHDVTIKQAYGDVLNAAPVACSEDHTLVVSAVRPVADGIDMADSEAVDEAAACHLQTEKLVGRDPLLRARTLYYTFVFLPTLAQQEAGARWASCHVSVWDARGLNDLPSTLPKVRKKPAAAVGRCLDRKSELVTCAEKHAYRTTHTFFLKASGSKAAVHRKVRAKGAPVCVRKAGRASLFNWFSYSRKPGKVIVLCYTKTTR